MAIRLEMRNLGLKNAEIAEFIGISATSFGLLKRTREYRVMKNQYLTGILSEMDGQVSDNLDLHRRIIQTGIPIALENLLAHASQKTNPNLNFRASCELLDREGHFAKVTRIGMPTAEQGGITNKEDADVAAELVKAFRVGAKQIAEENQTAGQGLSSPDILDADLTQTTESKSIQ